MAQTGEKPGSRPAPPPDPRMPWQSAKMIDQIDRARAQATANRRFPELPGKVIAELTFGF